MKKYQKLILMALTPTISVMHSQWIAYLLGAEWNNETRFFAVVVAIFALAVEAAVFFAV